MASPPVKTQGYIFSTFDMCRKPILALPVWADGNDAVNNMVDRGACVRIEKGASNSEVVAAITEASPYHGKFFSFSTQLPETFGALLAANPTSISRTSLTC